MTVLLAAYPDGVKQKNLVCGGGCAHQPITSRSITLSCCIGLQSHGFHLPIIYSSLTLIRAFFLYSSHRAGRKVSL